MEKDGVYTLNAKSTTVGLIADDTFRFDPKASTRNIIENRFTYHPPKEGQPEKYGEIREAGKEFALKLTELCPEWSVEFIEALKHIDNAVFWANASIARNEGK
ncbi:hypothetical protein F400_gp070 [Bacillus phage BCD7]|uniref:Acb2/Tad1 hairpin domain-containing protein n=1 Tax=Bacillus phage BCD7 TaxID=1136534 RepID=J9PUD4_9CAUD|nr:hypothetical protein F400_gp070 [Bacillus phage BCD7]AEZ50517.1 hypothetical protein BCD7_0070 [Bacillus phage BCD7]